MARHTAQMTQWAALGASTRLAQLDVERAEILKAFPNLHGTKTDAVGTRPKRRISAKARKAMREGMKRYWAKRRAAKK